MNLPESRPARFPATFWTANTIELFERAAYYSMASFVVIYLKEILGMSPTLATFLNGSVLWGLIYFLPILSGTLADRYGFKRSLVVAFVMLSLGYVVMGNMQKILAGDRRGSRGRPRSITRSRWSWESSSSAWAVRSSSPASPARCRKPPACAPPWASESST